MIFTGNHQLLPHPRPLAYKGADLDRYYRTGFSQPPTATTTASRPPVGALPAYACPAPFVPYAAYIDPAGNYEYPGCKMPSGTTPAPAPPHGVPGGGTPGQPGGTTSTTTTTTTTTSDQGTPAPNDMLLWLAVAALAFVMVSK